MHWPEVLTELSTPLPKTTEWLVLMCYGAHVSLTGLKPQSERHFVSDVQSKGSKPRKEGKVRGRAAYYSIPTVRSATTQESMCCGMPVGNWVQLAVQGLGHKGATARRHNNAKRKRGTTQNPRREHAGSKGSKVSKGSKGSRVSKIGKASKVSKAT